MTASDAPSCGFTYDHHSDDSRGVIYDRNIFIIQDIWWKKFYVMSSNETAHFLIFNYYKGRQLEGIYIYCASFIKFSDSSK
jgi:hypothetical protein